MVSLGTRSRFRFLRGLLSSRGLRGAFASFVVAGLAPAPARAEAGDPPSKAAALSFDSEDSPEIAASFTKLVRARIRTQLTDVQVTDGQPASLFAAAFHCPTRPDDLCLRKIADKLKVDRLLFGSVSHRSGSSSEVLVEAHFWTRGKGETHLALVYPQDLPKSALETAVSRVLDKLLVPRPQSTVEFRTSDVPGAYVQLESGARVALESGDATADFAPGKHAVEIVATGYETAKIPVDVESGVDEVLQIPLKPTVAPKPAADASDKGAHGHVDVRTIGAWSSVGLGVVAGVISIAEASRYAHFKDVRQNTFDQAYSRASVCGGAASASAQQAHLKPGSGYSAADFCGSFDGASSASTVAIVSGVAAAALLTTGIVLLTSKHKEDAAPKTAMAPSRLRFTPRLGAEGGGLDVRLSFE